MNLSGLILGAVYSGITLYMLLVLLRWLGPYIQLDFYDSRLRWIAAIVDPLLRFIRKIAPAVGPVDLGPLIALLLLWFARTVAVRAIAGSQL
ncbi:MAG: YggT family protein [Candidatus Hydrogenedentes bacterium]|nr:YggT family protein [Candidatus Hydrogenedentota bacterium]